MKSEDANESPETERALGRIALGNDDAINELFAEHRAYIRRLIELRIDANLRGRVDPSDVVQETLLATHRRIHEFILHRPTSFRVWLRSQTIERLIDTRRLHRRQKRDVRREVQINDESTLAVAAYLMRDTPSEAAIRQELMQLVHSALQELDQADREVILLRHAEMLTNAETAEILSITVAAASKRYSRAIARLSSTLRRLGFSGPVNGKQRS